MISNKKMKIKITCPKCSSTNVSITSNISNLEDPTPLYKCNNCGYKHNLFPKLWKEETRPSDAELEEGEEED